jgi:hypothetical protein
VVSLFNPPIVNPNVLTDEQKQRAAALIITNEAHRDLSVSEHVALASYVMDGPGGYIGFYTAWDDTDDIEREEVRDGDGNLIVVNDTNVGGGRSVYESGGIGDE